MIATNGNGCSDTALVTIAINPKPDLGSDKTVNICPGSWIDLAAQFTTTGLGTNWTIGGLTVGTSSFITAAGIYQLIATNGTGCADTALVTVAITPKPNLGPDRSISVCSGIQLNLATQFTTTGLTSSWTLAGIPFTSPGSVTTAGIYQLIAANGSGCSDTALITVTINPKPIIVITNPAPVCSPATADLTATAITAGSASGLTYTYWKDIAATVPYTTALTASTGTYYIKGINSAGCSDIKPVIATVYPLPVVHVGKDTTICYKASALLHGSVSNASAATSYMWSPASNFINPGAMTTMAKPDSTTLYTLTVNVNYNTCAFTVTDNILVTMQPPVNAFAGNDTNVIFGMPLQLQATGGVKYLWSPYSPLNNAYIPNPLATLHQDTKFVVTVYDIAGCKATDTVFVKVYKGEGYYVPNAFTPNGDGLNNVFRPIPVGIVATDWFRVFNRYGEIVFETNKFMEGWDGTYKGKKQEMGNYVWILKGRGISGKVYVLKGNVVLIR